MEFLTQDQILCTFFSSLRQKGLTLTEPVFITSLQISAALFLILIFIFAISFCVCFIISTYFIVFLFPEESLLIFSILSRNFMEDSISFCFCQIDSVYWQERFVVISQVRKKRSLLQMFLLVKDFFQRESQDRMDYFESFGFSYQEQVQPQATKNTGLNIGSHPYSFYKMLLFFLLLANTFLKIPKLSNNQSIKAQHLATNSLSPFPLSFSPSLLSFISSFNAVPAPDPTPDPNPIPLLQPLPQPLFPSP